MENVKRARKSGMLSKLGQAIREECEREWEAENQPGTSRRQEAPGTFSLLFCGVTLA